MMRVTRREFLQVAGTGAALTASGASVLAAGAQPGLQANASAESDGQAAGKVKIPTPTREQRAWQDMELISFAHFGVNTFTDSEWGTGQEDPAIFNPTALDANQWVSSLKSAGSRMLILTCKHHDGFCLWPTKFTDHSVKSSPWKGGKGDVVAEVSRACHAGGLKFGIYLSPWDRHEPFYGDSPRYNEFFLSQLRELLTGYGPVTEVWFDGANGEGPNGRKQVYDWPAYFKLIRELQPHALIAISGPDIRWVGNETGVAREDESSVQGSPGAQRWYPAECDVSIRPGWFYHPSEDTQVKSLSDLMSIYDRSVGRNSVLLLNVPPDRRGLFADPDVKRLDEFGAEIRRQFGKPLAQVHGVTPELSLSLHRPATVSRVILMEDIAYGERVNGFVIEAQTAAGWAEIAHGRVIGHKRIFRFAPVQVTALRLRCSPTSDRVHIREFAVFEA